MRRLVLICTFLAAFFSVLAHGSGGDTLLTPEERRWLAENRSRIVLAVETGYAPFVFLDPQGKATGLAHDYVRLIEAKIDAVFPQRQFSSLDAIFEKLRAGEVSIVNAVTQTPARAQFLAFTEPFIVVPNVILVRKERPAPLREENLSGLKVSLVKSYAVTEYLGARSLGLVADLVADDLTALLHVSFGRSDAAVVDLATASYLISQNGITNLQVAGETAFSIRLAIGTPLDEPVLHGILQKALAAITAAERQEIHRRWINASGQSIFSDWRLWATVGGVLLAILAANAAIFAWNRALRRQVQARTAELEVERAHLEQRVRERTDELARSEAQLRATLDNAPNVAIQWYDEAGRVIYWNIASEKLFGWTAAEALGQTMDALILDPDEAAEFLRILGEIRHSGRPHGPRELSRHARDGRSGWILSTFFAIPMAGGRSGFVCMDVDITERKQAEAKAEAANLAKSRFLATMSHEIRTPLNGILGMAQLLLLPGIDESERQEYSRVIINSGQTLLTLLNDILDLSKVEAGRIELEALVFDPAQLVREIAALFAERADAKRLAVEVAWHGAQNPRYRADPSRLRQMLSNLVGNAIKFTAQGFVRIEGREAGDAEADVLLEFSVSDSGIGIPADKQALLFKPFSQVDASTTREYGGSGLGLSIVRNLAVLMGGDVGVDSAAGKGTRVWFRVRAQRVKDGDESRQSVRGTLAAAATETPPATAWRVLVVEDDATNRKVIEAMLKRQDIHCESVGNGQEAVARIVAGAQPHLVLMDCRMPVMDGYEATRRIRQWERDGGKPTLPVIALTASAYEEDRQHCLAAGMNDFLAKPLVLQDLKAVLERWLGSR